MFKVSYLPLALEDLKGIIKYITYTLEAPSAALNLKNKIDKEVSKLKTNPFRCHIYMAPVKLKYEYRILNVNNYSLFYVVEENKVEIHRVIYSKRDIPQLLKNSPTPTAFADTILPQ